MRAVGQVICGGLVRAVRMDAFVDGLAMQIATKSGAKSVLLGLALGDEIKVSEEAAKDREVMPCQASRKGRTLLTACQRAVREGPLALSRAVLAPAVPPSKVRRRIEARPSAEVATTGLGLSTTAPNEKSGAATTKVEAQVP